MKRTKEENGTHGLSGIGNQAGSQLRLKPSRSEAIENESGSMAYLALRKALYPGACGYAMETGGVMSLIRSLTVDEIRAYHSAYYRPDNCFIVVAGKVLRFVCPCVVLLAQHIGIWCALFSEASVSCMT